MNYRGNNRGNNFRARNRSKRKYEFDNDQYSLNSNKRRFNDNSRYEHNDNSRFEFNGNPPQYQGFAQTVYVDGNDSRPHTVTNQQNNTQPLFPNDEIVNFTSNNLKYPAELPSRNSIPYSANNRLKLIRANISKPYDRNTSEPPNRNPNFTYKVVTYNNTDVRQPNSTNNYPRFLKDGSNSSSPKFSANDRLQRIKKNLPSNEGINRNEASTSATDHHLHQVKSSSLDERLKNFKRNYEKNECVPNEELAELLEASPIASEPNIINNNLSSVAEQTFEAMDCSTVDEKEVLSNLQDLRKINNENAIFKPQTQFQEIIACASKDFKVNKSLYKTIYIVVDTNIFISHLKLIKELMAFKINGVVAPVIFVPWMVIQELDHLKDGKAGDKLRTQARAAVHFINSQLSNKSLNLRGQSVKDAFKVNLSSTNADDGVLHCAMQIIENGDQSYLLSNDVNLRNKAIINGIDAYSHDNIFKKIDPFNDNCRRSSINNLESDAIKNIKTPLSHLFSYIILKEMKNAFGKLWSKMISSPPWNLKECLDLFKKYWQSTFSLKLQKQCKTTIDKFILILESESGDSDKFKKELVEIAISLCVYLKNGYQQYVDSVNDCVTTIEQEQLPKTI